MDRQTSPMTAERWMQLKKIFAAVQGKPPAEQAEMVCALAQGDEELEAAARDLLAADESAGSFLQAPAADLHSPLLAPGTRLGPYQILGVLGEGGMGKVYRGLDTRLSRAVAIKISAEQFSKRFELEARAISALNHPNICTLYDVGPNYLVTELVEGETLRDWLEHTPALERRLETMRQVLEALRAAHCAGIVHRDLKPQNIMVRFDGYVKVLDFGLAKQLPTARSAPRETIASSDASAPGQIVGTVAYMSPEQIQGHPVDQRSDLFAVGIILFEMLTGQHPWPRASIVDTLHAIVHDQPPPMTVAAPWGAKLAPLVRKLLAKSPAERYPLAEGVLEALNSSMAPQIASVAATEPSARRKRSNQWIIALVILLLVAVAAGSYLFFSRSHRVLTEKDTVILADFSNSTGDPVFDGTLRQGLSVQLEQSPFLSLISEDRIKQVLRMMDQPEDARLTTEIAREACQRTGSTAVLDGSIANLGSQYVLGLKAVDCNTGDILAEEQATVSSKEQVLGGLSDAAAKLRAKLGETLSTVQKFDTPLEQATTPSLEALQAYSLGRKAGNGNDWTAAIPFFRRAIRLDPNFAMAYARLGNSYRNLGERSLGAENTLKSYELRERVSEREKFYIESHYYAVATGDLEEARQTCELWAQIYPRDWSPLMNLFDIYSDLGQSGKSLEKVREALRLDPTPLGYSNLVLAYFALNRFEDARTTAEEALAKKFDSVGIRTGIYRLAFLENNTAGMAEQVAWAAGKPGAEGVLLAGEADTAAYFGRIASAREFSRRAVASTARAEENEVAALYEGNEALREALFGNAVEAGQRAAAALGLSNGRNVQFEAALALALAGYAEQAQLLADDLGKRFPEDTLVRFKYIPTIHAQLELSRNDSSKAIDALQAAAPYELGATGGLFPVYVRGGAYLAAHRGSEAAAEFQKILDHSGIVVDRPIGALAHLGLARAYGMQGDTAKAKSAYQAFLTLWKDADPGIPILKQAKAEYAKLP
jgi:serine/threonine protein kinase/tetratricopeptide (TPR) repeat protein